MKKKMVFNRTTVLLISLIVITLFIFSGCLFLYFHGKDNVGKTATVVFSYSDDASKLLIDQSVPITDEVGKNLSFIEGKSQQGYTEFSISSNMFGMESLRYEIYAKSVGVSMELPHRYVKLYLTDGESDLALPGYDERRVPTFKDLKISASDPSAKQIYTGELVKDETKNFRLRMWLADTYPMTMEHRSFGILLYVKVIK